MAGKVMACGVCGCGWRFSFTLFSARWWVKKEKRGINSGERSRGEIQREKEKLGSVLEEPAQIVQFSKLSLPLILLF